MKSKEMTTILISPRREEPRESVIISSFNSRRLTQKLDLHFRKLEKFDIIKRGPGAVHLTGNLLEKSDHDPRNHAEIFIDSEEYKKIAEEKKRLKSVKKLTETNSQVKSGDERREKIPKPEKINVKPEPEKVDHLSQVCPSSVLKENFEMKYEKKYEIKSKMKKQLMELKSEELIKEENEYFEYDEEKDIKMELGEPDAIGKLSANLVYSQLMEEDPNETQILFSSEAEREDLEDIVKHAVGLCDQ